VEKDDSRKVRGTSTKDKKKRKKKGKKKRGGGGEVGMEKGR